jgi:hypothetical protein
MVPAVAADELHDTASLGSDHPISVHLFFVDPPVVVERARQ